MTALYYHDPLYDFKNRSYLLWMWLLTYFASIFANFNQGEGIPDITVPDSTPRPSRAEVEARSAATMARLFSEDEDTPGGDPPPPDKPPKKPPEEEEEESEEESEEEESEDGEEESEETDPDAFDYEDDEEEETPKPDDEEEEEEEEEGSRETKAQRDAKLNGRKAKKLETELTETKLQIARQAEELKAAKERLEAYDRVTIDPKSVPEYQTLNAAMWDDVDAAVAEELPQSAAGLADASRFNSYMTTYLKAVRLAGPERAAAILDLKAKIVAELGGFEDPYAELLDDDKAAADVLSRDVLGVIRRNKDKAESLIKLETDLRNKAKVGKLAFGAREYERTRSSLEPLIESLGKLEDKLVEENPYSPEAVVTQLAKAHPKLQKKLDTAKADVLEVVLGERPLTEKEYDSLEEQGVNIKEFLKERSRKFEEKKARLIPLLVRGLFATGITKKALENIAKEQRGKQDQADELEALGAVERRRGKKPVKAKAKAEPKVPARERPLAIDAYIGSED